MLRFVAVFLTVAFYYAIGVDGLRETSAAHDESALTIQDSSNGTMEAEYDWGRCCNCQGQYPGIRWTPPVGRFHESWCFNTCGDHDGREVSSIKSEGECVDPDC